MKKEKLLIFIITYKAKKRVYNVFKKINFKQLKNYRVSLLISDDCSRDTTINYSRKILKNFKNSKLNINKKNLGYGGNIKKCLSYGIKNKFKYLVAPILTLLKKSQIKFDAIVSMKIPTVTYEPDHKLPSFLCLNAELICWPSWKVSIACVGKSIDKNSIVTSAKKEKNSKFK